MCSSTEGNFVLNLSFDQLLISSFDFICPAIIFSDKFDVALYFLALLQNVLFTVIDTLV